jgi:beta-N-acetylhexosaminidase
MGKHILIFHIVLMLALVSCNKNEKVENKVEVDKPQIYDSTVKSNGIYSLKDFLKEDSMLNKRVNLLFDSLNDTERVAQMIMTSAGANGKPFDTVKKLISSNKIGGVILMGGSKNSFKSLISKFDSINQKNDFVPLFYSIDAEPGFVGSRINGTSSFPPQSKINSSAESDTIARKISDILKEIGLNINFAPVCDMSNNKEIIGDRSFGKDSNKIIEFASAFIKETQNNNIIATVKHFPGHGNVKGDSHKENVFIDGALTELETFKKIINTGVTAVMVGHITIKNNIEYETGGLPSTLSKKIVTDLLRNKLGFKGLIISDALNMGAVTKIDKPAFKSALAGCDILLMPTDELKLLNSILTEMTLNIEFKKQVYESVKRIIKAKLCLNLSFKASFKQ